jgi:DNA-binding beta-propeller fold protein YncE
MRVSKRVQFIMGLRGLRRWCAAGSLVCACLSAQRAPIPRSDELPGSPFAIKKTWVIGGTGNWDYLTLDPTARQLFVTHQSAVQVVDLDTGSVIGEVSRFGEAHAVALNPDGETGYVSDGRSNMVFVFDRRSFRITDSIYVPASPRALVFDPGSGMLVAFSALPVSPPPARTANQAGPPPRSESWCGTQSRSWPPPPAYQSLISVIDPGKKARIADVQVCGVLGAAAADGAGVAYFAISNFNAVGRLNISDIAQLARDRPAGEVRQGKETIAADSLQLDARASYGAYLRVFQLGRECREARAVAVDAAHQRLFAACANQTLKVLASDSGAPVASVTIGPGVDAMAYDAGRGLIYTANGGGYGSVSIVRQHLTDSYGVVQNLPTMQQARTVAVDPSTGLVYLVTTLYGADLRNPPSNGIGALKMAPVDGSFQVLVVGN